MQWFNNLTIRQKMYAVALPAAAVFLAYLGYAYYLSQLTMPQLVVGMASIVVLLGVVGMSANSMKRPLDYAIYVANSIGEGNWEQRIRTGRRDEAGQLLTAIDQLSRILADKAAEDNRREHAGKLLAELNNQLRGEMDVRQLGSNLLSYLVPSLDAQLGAFYTYNEDDNQLELSSSYGLNQRKHLGNVFALGESIVGQCALEKQQILLKDVPDDYLAVQSATGQSTPATVIVTPILHEDELQGVLELAAFRQFESHDMMILNKGVDAIAIAVQTARNRVRLRAMLQQTREQADALEHQKDELRTVNDDLEQQAMELSLSESKLQQQQEELRATNEELESQTQALKASEESLQAQQEELRVTNEELESQANILAEQKAELSTKNGELEKLHDDLSDKLRELELSSKYKSEFLSTMSHELRTPLNSILILSNSLSSNKSGTLTDKQVEHAQVIHSAGSDLLALINDILDISKIEEGKMDVIIDTIEPSELGEAFRLNFSHVAENRGVSFHVELADDLPERIYTDQHRVEQIIKNLLSNALKFTDEGSVTLSISRPDDSEMLPIRSLTTANTIKLSVTDTGVGIPEDKQRLIFEAFQQADGTTSRKYGGTGLGLTISRELARLLKGDIGLYSAGEGKGTTFTLYLPIGEHSDIESGLDQPADSAPTPAAKPAPKTNQPPATDQPVEFQVNEKDVLIIEDDATFAQVLADLAAEYGLEGHVCEDGESGLEYATQHRPSAIILDIGLPGISGWDVMEKLKAHPRTKDIPVHFLSGAGKGERSKAMSLGAIDFLSKPVSEKDLSTAFDKIEVSAAGNVRHLLVVEDSEVQHQGINALFDEKGVEIHAAKSGEEALALLKEQAFDCMILDLSLPDMSGEDLLRTLQDNDEHRAIPVIVYTGRDMSRDEEARLRKYADRIILKTERSSERLLNEASLFLHWLESTLPTSKEPSPELIAHRDGIFEDKKLLLVDDDMRNIYALSAELEELGFDITLANNGREALDVLAETPDIDLVLMDIMMPEMDGYEAMQHIREQPQFADLPVLALTAKAMKEDRSKCIEAGANDYCSKPIDMNKLVSLLRVWLRQ